MFRRSLSTAFFPSRGKTNDSIYRNVAVQFKVGSKNQQESPARELKINIFRLYPMMYVIQLYTVVIKSA